MSSTESRPTKFWASEQGAIDLQPLGAVPYRPEQLVDRLMIAETFHRFGIAHDENRLDVLLSLMTDDVRYEFAVGSASPELALHGRDAVRAHFEPRLAAMQGQRRHCVTNIVVEHLTESTASAIAYGVVPVAADGLGLFASVIYAADLRQSDGVWRFSRLFIGVDDFSELVPRATPHTPFRPA